MRQREDRRRVGRRRVGREIYRKYALHSFPGRFLHKFTERIEQREREIVKEGERIRDKSKIPDGSN